MELDDSQISYFDFGILVCFHTIPKAENAIRLLISDIFAVIRMTVGLHRRYGCVGIRAAREGDERGLTTPSPALTLS
jgi:hypothetical protein